MRIDPNYWLVGATWNEGGEKYHDFIANGYWESGYEKDEKPTQDDRFDQIQPGDRIAIKRSLGPADPDIIIRAIGVVSEVDLYGRRVYVTWLVRGLNRKIGSRGAYATIHGPYNRSQNIDSWLNSAFCI
ncbi:MAG: hypothetical protein KA914_04890 [Ottowia sp.]|nr:hypothetical protein [Ottowia sp.]